MYYCPCPCSEPPDPDSVEENTYFSLPRNLSYVQESFLDAHDVSGRFVYNPRTDRQISANNAANATEYNPTSLNGDHHDHYSHYHHYNDHHHHSNGVAGSGGNASSTITTTTISIATTAVSSNRWCSGDTKVEAEFGKGKTGRNYFPCDFEEVINREKNIGKKGEGEKGETCIEVEGDEGENDDCDEKFVDFLSVLKSRRDPTVHFGCVTTPPNTAASDFTTKSSVVGVQSHEGNGLYCVDVNVNSSSCGGNSVSNTDLTSVSLSTTSTVSLSVSPTASASTSSSNLNPSSTSPQPSSSSSSSSSSKPSFIKRVRSLLSPKDDEIVSVSPTPQLIRDLGSSVDGEAPDSDSAGPSQPLILRSPDRSGLVMDRGEDLIAPSPSDCDQKTALLNCETSSSASSHTNAISSPLGLDDGHAVHSGSSGDEPDEVIVIQYREWCHSEPDSTKAGSENSQSKLVKHSKPCALSHQSSYSPPEFYNEGLIESSGHGVRMSETCDKQLIDSSNKTTTIESQRDADSDAFSEEGVFVNMVDDTDVIAGRPASDVSDDTTFSVDSMLCSPSDLDPTDDEVVLNTDDDVNNDDNSADNDKSGNVKTGLTRRMSLEEAISKAASDFNKMTMLLYPDLSSTAGLTGEDFKAGLDIPSTSKAWDGSERLRNLARGSPIHGIPPLSVQIGSASDFLSNSDPSGLQQRAASRKESPIYDDHEFNFNKQGLRKSSSLKTNKTPPGTPHRKKAVRFADAMGLDLESVRHVLNTESPPKIPASAMADLKKGLSCDPAEVGSRYLTACFTQPGATNNFVKTVLSQKVRLENAIVTNMTITGFIRVSNIAFHKNVRVRYTHNSWSTFHDIAASYIKDSCDGPTDRFSFSIVAPAYFTPGNRLEFAVSYNAEGAEFWDNNGGENYVFECFAKTVPTDNDREWIHFL